MWIAIPSPKHALGPRQFNILLLSREWCFPCGWLTGASLRQASIFATSLLPGANRWRIGLKRIISNNCSSAHLFFSACCLPWYTTYTQSQLSTINSTVCVGRLLCWMWQVLLAWHWERVTTMVLQAVSLRFYVPSENGVTPLWFCSTNLSGICVLPLWRQLRWLFDLWSKLNQEPRSCGK